MLNLIPLHLIFLTLILVIIPSIAAGILRYSLYRHLTDSANKVTRLLTSQTSRGQQPKIVEILERRFREASQQLEKVNTIALIDGIYTQEKFTFFNLSLRCEQWDYFCNVLPNLLLAFGLLGTFFGITGNLYDLSQTIDKAQGDINGLVTQLQAPLQNMGIAFITSLMAIAFSSLLTVVNLRCNTNLAKSLFITSLEDYLDNIFQPTIEGKTRLDKSIDSMVKQQEEFLTRFHEKVGQVLEQTIGNAANKMVSANQNFQNNVDSLVSRFQDVSGSLAASTDSFQQSTFTLKEQIQAVTKIVPQVQQSSQKLENGSTIFQLAANKIEQSKFSENLENLTANLATTQKSFAQSTEFLGNQVTKIADSHQQAVQLAEQVYSQLQEASQKLQYSAMGFVEASQTIQQSDFADKLAIATKELAVIPTQFQESTAILHQSIPSLNKAIAVINKSANKNINLVEQVNSLNQHSTQILESSDKRIELETASFDRIQLELNKIVSTLNRHSTQIFESSSQKLELETASFDRIQVELNQIVSTLNQHQEQVNLSMEKFGGRLLASFEQKTDTHTQKLQLVGDKLEQYSIHLNETKSELAKIPSALKQHEQQITSGLNSIGITNDRLLKSFQQQAENNIQQLQQVTNNLGQSFNGLDRIQSELSKLISQLEQHGEQVNLGLNKLSDRLLNNSSQQLDNYNKQLAKLTENFNRII
jgi:DNA repair exonuclease SbcCD ATPase subunit